MALSLGCLITSGCASLSYEKEWFPADHVRVLHSERHCKDVDQPGEAGFPNADLVAFFDIGHGHFVATKAGWEATARQLAAELDSDVSLIMPCDGNRSSLYA
ncbi:MAG TPA: hypothetical protein VLA72_22715 [Anaerolineales bacterium]|nr:hypothetical protein [Anaerolineales bacterium]